MNDLDLFEKFHNSLVELIQVVEQINGMDFDVYTHKRTHLLIHSLELLNNHKQEEITAVAYEIMTSIYRWYDGGFKRHTEEEQNKQKTAVSNLFNSSVQYLLINGNDQQKMIAQEYFEH
ncbi:MAG: hypothetical protein JAY90_12035 [Candidatus Thiodiazotropha lotti]|nr:hypothetical protein [Candidatus Thiodiazotropha lotti]